MENDFRTLNLMSPQKRIKNKIFMKHNVTQNIF